MRSGTCWVDWGIDSNDGSRTKVCLYMDSDDAIGKRKKTLPAVFHEEAAFGLRIKAMPS